MQDVTQPNLETKTEEIKLAVTPQDAPKKEPTPEEQEKQLSLYFDIYANRLIPLIDKLSNKSLRRVLKAVTLLPVRADYQPNFKIEDEKAAYQLFEHILPIKVIFIERAMIKFQEEEEAKFLKEQQEKGLKEPEKSGESLSNSATS